MYHAGMPRDVGSSGAVAPLLRVRALGRQPAFDRMAVTMKDSAAAARNPNSRRGQISNTPKGGIGSIAVAAVDTPSAVAVLLGQRYSAQLMRVCV